MEVEVEVWGQFVLLKNILVNCILLTSSVRNCQIVQLMLPSALYTCMVELTKFICPNFTVLPLLFVMKKFCIAWSYYFLLQAVCIVIT
jgi:hypothetical protein